MPSSCSSSTPIMQTGAEFWAPLLACHLSEPCRSSGCPGTQKKSVGLKEQLNYKRSSPRPPPNSEGATGILSGSVVLVNTTVYVPLHTDSMHRSKVQMPQLAYSFCEPQVPAHTKPISPTMVAPVQYTAGDSWWVLTTALAVTPR